MRTMAADNGSALAASILRMDYEMQYKFSADTSKKRIAEYWDAQYRKNAISECSEQIRGREVCMDFIEVLSGND